MADNPRPGDLVVPQPTAGMTLVWLYPLPNDHLPAERWHAGTDRPALVVFTASGWSKELLAVLWGQKLWNVYKTRVKVVAGAGAGALGAAQ